MDSLLKIILKPFWIVIPSPVKKFLVDFIKQLRNFKILGIDYGQFLSIRNWSCLNAEKNPIPWYTYPAIEYLQHLDLSAFNVFEFGSGNSTLFWSKIASNVCSVEDDPLWFDKISKESQKQELNFQYILASEPSSYIQAFLDSEPTPDIIIIDGQWRTLCAEKVTEYINERGGVVMIIFDNSDWYPKTINGLRENLKWIEIDFHGFGPINDYTWTTTVFLNPQMTSLVYSKPLMSVRGLSNNGEETHVD
jgi:hypothetical protein